MSTETTRLSEGAHVAKVDVEHGDLIYRPGALLPPTLPGLDELIKYGSAEHVPDHDGGIGDVVEHTAWRTTFTVEKYEGGEGVSEARAAHPDIAPDDTVVREGNLLTIGGASILWERLISDSPTKFDNTNGYLGVGDSSTAAADTQTDLQAASNKVRKAMDATYPTHTDSTGTAGSKSITYKSTFTTSDGNFAWAEWALFNASTAGRMLNRKVESLGTKTSSATWVLTITLSLA